jgi:hypothetical protein
MNNNNNNHNQSTSTVALSSSSFSPTSSSLSSVDSNKQSVVCAFCACDGNVELGQGELIRLNSRYQSLNTNDDSKTIEDIKEKLKSTTPTNLNIIKNLQQTFNVKMPDNLANALVKVGWNLSNLAKFNRTYVHSACLKWSQGSAKSYQNDILIVKTTSDHQLISESLIKKCSICNNYGASLRCSSAMGCSEFYHLPCLTLMASCYQDLNSNRILCLRHANEAADQFGDTSECLICDQTVVNDNETNTNNNQLLNQLFCASCGAHYHDSCLSPPIDGSMSLIRIDWQCPECKCCQLCGETGDDTKLLVCDSCDKCYHIFCLNSAVGSMNKMNSLEGAWKCPKCKLCSSCGKSRCEIDDKNPFSNNKITKWFNNDTCCPKCHDSLSISPKRLNQSDITVNSKTISPTQLHQQPVVIAVSVSAPVGATTPTKSKRSSVRDILLQQQQLQSQNTSISSTVTTPLIEIKKELVDSATNCVDINNIKTESSEQITTQVKTTTKTTNSRKRGGGGGGGGKPSSVHRSSTTTTTNSNKNNKQLTTSRRSSRFLIFYYFFLSVLS